MSEKKYILVLIPLLLVGAAALFFLIRPTAPPTPPNIVLIIVDTLRADHLGCHGYDRNTSPNIDALAKDAILFENAISSAPWTTPSVATLLTSQHPTVLGIRDKPAIVSPDFPRLAQILKQNNYATHAVITHALLSARLGFATGFDVYDEGSTMGHRGSSSASVTEKAVAFLKRKHNRPFFLMLHYFDPHYNYMLHPKYDFFPSYDGPVRGGEHIQDLWAKRSALSPTDIEYVKALYDSEIAHNDAYIGKLLDELKRLDLYENSMIILTADHGEEFMERGWIGHSITLHQELIHVPLIIKPPQSPSGIVESRVGLIDVMPTILHHCRFDIPETLDGRPLPLDGSDDIASRPIFSETSNPQIHRSPAEPVQPITCKSVVLGQWKLIYDLKTGKRQFYNLADDPLGRKNRPDAPNEQRTTMQQLLGQYILYIKKKEKAGPLLTDEQMFTEEQIKQLQSLGYL